MVVVPAWVWRGGRVSRAVVLGLIAGIVLATLSFADSGVLLGSLVVLVILVPFYALLMGRRMRRFWPGADELSGADRVTVARAARRGDRIAEKRLAPAVIDYSQGLRAAAEQARPHRWVVWLLLAVAVIVALIDTFVGTILNGFVSWLFVVFFVLEVWWWPRIQDHLLANADSAANMARQQQL